MKVQLSYLWEKVSSSYWFVPLLMLAGSAGLSIVTVELDRFAGDSLVERLDWVREIEPAGARALLSVVASSMITVAGVVFSITVVVLTLASSQYGPRVLRNFFRDMTTSGVFGTFLATFLYCLLVLRVVDEDADMRVPYGSVTVALVFAIASLLVLVFFIHHISSSIQASAIVAEAYEELVPSIERTFPERGGDGESARESTQPQNDGFRSQDLCAVTHGYILRIDAEGLVETAKDLDIVVEIVLRPGLFAVEGRALAKLHTSRPVEDDRLDELRRFFVVGPERTPYQDVLFATRQLVEIAVRSLSPGTNDPFTAILCLDYLEAALCRAAERDEPQSRRFDDDGNLRLVAEPIRFPELADAAWSEIRHYGASDPAVSKRLMASIANVGARVSSQGSRQTLQHQARALIEICRTNGLQEHDLAPIEAELARLERIVSAPAATARLG